MTESKGYGSIDCRRRAAGGTGEEMSDTYTRFKQTKNYRIEFKQGRKWVDAGDIYEEQSKTQCRKEMCSANFFGQKVRMVEYINTWKFEGVVEERDFTK